MLALHRLTIQQPHYFLRFSLPIPSGRIIHLEYSSVTLAALQCQREALRGMLGPCICVKCTVSAQARTGPINISLSSYLIETSSVLNSQALNALHYVWYTLHSTRWIWIASTLPNFPNFSYKQTQRQPYRLAACSRRAGLYVITKCPLSNVDTIQYTWFVTAELITSQR